MDGHININTPIFLTRETIHNSFKDTLEISLNKGVDVFLFKKCNIINFDFIKSYLILQPEWVFCYYIPKSDTCLHNYVLLALNKNFFNFDKYFNILKFEEVEKNSLTILNFLTYGINWESENITNHSCNWKDQIFFSELIDYITTGVISFLPPHWGKPFYLS